MVTGVTLKGICKSFQSRGRVVSPLKDFSLNLEPGKLTAVLGKSGCGKTTLLKVISGLEERDAGEISFFDEAGRPVSSPKLSLVFQDPRLLPWKTVEENLRFGLELKKLPKKEIDERVENIIKLMGLQNFRDTYPHQLSVSTEQRIIIGRAFAMNPDLLLMDDHVSPEVREQYRSKGIEIQ